MKIQSLAVIAIVIILPMAMILNVYSTSQIKTLEYQISYDSKLQSATYDAIKAFQMNMSNSTTSDLANSKMRDIKASIQTFYKSLSSHFNMAGYGEDLLKDYVPAVVYTLYDGYYIYSAYTNQLDNEDVFYDEATYKDVNEDPVAGEIYGLKPYIYYSCRYVPNNNSDFVITYSLDSYITIQGQLDGKPINESGYLLTGVAKNVAGNYTYKGVEILPENNKDGLKQKVYIHDDNITAGTSVYFNNDPTQHAGNLVTYPYKKINGVKYYKENNQVFALMNNEKLYQNDYDANKITQNDNGIKFYEDAYNFKQKILGNNTLKNLNTNDAVDNTGKKYSEYSEESIPYVMGIEIFAELNKEDTYIENEKSDFNVHRLEVIRNSIESNLMVAISNYNKVSTSDVNFAMPKLTEIEWETITQNICMITFLQGLSIGGKVYNGHAIVKNTINEDYVSENSIYILNNGIYYDVTSNELLNLNLNDGQTIGLLNTDFERRTVVAYYKKDIDGDGVTDEELKKNIYYYPREDEASYNSIISLNDINATSISEYFEDSGTNTQKYKLAQIYYTALGRERYSMYRVMNKIENVQSNLK